MGRKILFVTTDQQRFDALGCNGGRIARTPVVDALAAAGLNYQRAYNQNVVCMPARATMLTGQYPSTHGVFANGVPLPADAPSAAQVLRGAGYRTALIGKAHFEPAFDLRGRWTENRLAREGSTGPWRGFERMELAMHGPVGFWHYSTWIQQNFPAETDGFAPLLSAHGGGETGAPEVAYNPIPREHYHTDWVAERTIAFLDSLDAADDWFVWMSFPDPHHPWDPPASEARRVRWRDLELPAGHPGSRDRIAEVLARKPRHWLAWWEGRWRNPEGGPMSFVPKDLTDDQIREVNALVHVENELIDEACGRVLARIAERGWLADTDVFFTTDHGELQGDFGLLYKGPYHVDALMRLPFVWRPAPSAGVAPAVIDEPVGQLDLAPTFCAIAGVAAPSWMQGAPLPTAPRSGRERVLCEWDSQFRQVGMHMRTIYRDGWLCTAYGRTTRDEGWDLARVQQAFGLDVPMEDIAYDGTEGELYDVVDDPHQWRNRWDDPGCRARREAMLDDLRAHQPAPRAERLRVESPA